MDMATTTHKEPAMKESIIADMIATAVCNGFEVRKWSAPDGLSHLIDFERDGIVYYLRKINGRNTARLYDRATGEDIRISIAEIQRCIAYQQIEVWA
jgi:hypothetical protein